MNALRIAGYAALFGVADAGRDTILPGAFRETLRARGARPTRSIGSTIPNSASAGSRLRVRMRAACA